MSTTLPFLLQHSAGSAGELVSIGLAVAMFAAVYAYHRFWAYDELSDGERRAVDAALSLLDQHGFGRYARIGRQPGRVIRSSGKLRHWGYTPPTFRTTVLRTDAIAMDTPLLAALLLHELVHSTQRLWPLRGTASWEHQAYEVQSQFMKAVGLVGTMPDAVSVVGALPVNRAYLLDQAKSFKQYRVADAAIRLPRVV